MSVIRYPLRLQVTARLPGERQEETLGRVATVNTNISGGGAATVARTIWQRTVQDGTFASRFFYSFGAPSPSHLAERIGRRSSKALSAMAFRLFGNASWLLGANTTRYLDRLRGFDLVHLHNLHGYYVDARRLLRRLNRPFVWTLHDSWLCTGRCAVAFDCERWQSRGCRPCPNRAQAPATWWFDRAARDLLRKRAEFQTLLQRQPGYLVTPSNWLRRRVLAIGVPPERIRVIHNPVDTAQFRPSPDKTLLRRQLRLPLDKFLVLVSAAQLSDPLKGAHFMTPLRKYFQGNSSIHFVFVGKVRSDLQGINSSAMGYVTSLELLAQIYAACDLFVSTSLAENFPMCVVEAMASGIAVVAFDVGGICEQICQATGVLVPARDLQGMVRAIESLAAVESQGRVTDMGRAARAKCEASFSVDKVMAGYLALYAELLDAAPAVRRLAA